VTRILLSNDDGIAAAGIAAARRALAPLGEVVTVAPQHEQSASSHAITLNRPLRVSPQDADSFAVDGTPCDCIFMACEHLLQDRPIDLVVSGINAGANLGVDVLYSGTVAAAMEGAIRGLPAIAISQVGNHDLDFETAAAFLAPVARAVLERGLPAGVMLNVNVPKRLAQPVRYRFTALGAHRYEDVVEQRSDPRERPYYWIAGRWAGYEPIEGSDCAVIGAGQISITPLRFNLSVGDQPEALEAWGIEGFEAAES